MNGNNGLNDIISKLTENPEMMKNLMNVAGNIMNNNNSNNSNNNGNSDLSYDRHDRPPEPTRREEEKYGEKPEFDHRKRGDDAENLICLLLALKPYVSKDRCGKIDSIVKILKLVQLSEKTGLLKSLL